MSFYRHYSFDLWSTLIRSNLSFKEERANYFYKKYNHKHKSIEEIKSIFRQVDLMCNSINEKTGGNIESEEIYLIVISVINDYDIQMEDVNLKELYSYLEELLFYYIPKPYSDDTVTVLSQLKNTSGVSLNVLSNTAFIKGSTMRKVLKAIRLEEYFNFQIYSDEVGVSKPNRVIFQKLIDSIDREKDGSISKEEIIHIGDNPISDLIGARLSGIDALVINSNENSILSVLK